MASSSQQPTPQRPSAPAPVSKTDRRYDDEMPSANELMEIASKSLQTGAVTGRTISQLIQTYTDQGCRCWLCLGGVGLVVGAGSGIVRSAPPALFALVAGLQWFALGSSYMGKIRWRRNSQSRLLITYIQLQGASYGMHGVVKKILPLQTTLRRAVLPAVCPEWSVACSVSLLIATPWILGTINNCVGGPRNIIPGILFFGTVGATGQYISQRFRNKPQDDDSKPKSSWLDSKWSPMRRLTDKEYEEKLEEKILRIDAEISIIDDSIASLRAHSNSVKSDEKRETLQKSWSTNL